MPKVIIDYSKCSMYKIEHIEKESLVYIGHTTNFNQRKNKHKSICNNTKDNGYNRKIYKIIRDNGGWEMFRMIEIKKYPCKDKQEAEKGEYDIIQELKTSKNIQCMNAHFILSDEEKIQKQKHYEEYKKNKMNFDKCLDELDFYF